MWIFNASLVLLAIASAIALVYVAGGMADATCRSTLLLVAAVLAVAAFEQLGRVL